jgi:virulence factor
MKIIIVGVGGIARRAYLPLLTSWDNVEITGIFSRTQKSVGEVCNQWHITNGTTDVNKLMKSKPDAAFVLTNDATHFKFTKMLLEADVDVFVEKPAASTSHEAHQLASIAGERNRILIVGFNRRYALLYRKAKELFTEKKIQLVVIQKHRTKATHISLYNNYLDDTIHQIDLLRYYCGKVIPLDTHIEMRNKKLVGAVSTVALPEGGIGVLMTSLEAGAWQENATLYGEELTVEVDAFRQLRIKHHDHEEVYGTDRAGKWITDMKERGFHGVIKHFFECIETRKQPLTSGIEAARTQELMEQMVQAAGSEPGAPTGEWDRVERWENN